MHQLTEGDPLGRGPAVRSARTGALRPRTADADRVVGSGRSSARASRRRPTRAPPSISSGD